jgi:hypothetical protein
MTSTDFEHESWEGDTRQVSVRIESETRREADRALSRLDGRPAVAAKPGKLWEYVHLGALEVEIQFDPPLQKMGQSRAFVYLVPADIAVESWTGSRPTHGTVLFPPEARPQTRRSQTRPSRGATQRSTDARAAGLRSARLQFRGVTPGRYRVKVVNDRAHPYHMTVWQRPITPRPGDYQSADDTVVVEVTAGKTASAGEIRCGEPVVQGTP